MELSLPLLAWTSTFYAANSHEKCTENLFSFAFWCVAAKPLTHYHCPWLDTQHNVPKTTICILFIKSLAIYPCWLTEPVRSWWTFLNGRYSLYRVPFHSQKTASRHYSLTIIVIWIFWKPIHHCASTPCFNVLLVVCSDKSRFHHLLLWVEQIHSSGHAVLEIRSQLPSTGSCAHQTIDMAAIMRWVSTLRACLWQ